MQLEFEGRHHEASEGMGQADEHDVEVDRATSQEVVWTTLKDDILPKLTRAELDQLEALIDELKERGTANEHWTGDPQ